MNASETLNIRKPVAISILIALLGIAAVAPLTGNQFITGSIVNATLIVSTALLGIQNGMIVGIVPSIIALSTGLLPPVMAPMVPFIIMGNVILVIAFGYLTKKNYWLGAITGAILKFSFLWATSFIVINLLMSQQAAGKVALMMSWPQLVTALIGSLIAYGILRLSQRIHNNNQTAE